jgi:GT2 family glycosyltransferase
MHSLSPHEVIVIDNSSTDRQDPITKDYPFVLLIENHSNCGFAKANNQAAGRATGDILLFLNNDTIVQSDIITPVERVFADHSEVGIIGPRLLNADGSFQISAGPLPTFWSEIGDKVLYGSVERRIPLALRYAERRHSMTRHVGWVTGAALFIRRSLFMKLGGFDERMFMYFEDKDLCLRAWKEGFSVMYYPEVSLIHLKGGSGNIDDLMRLKTAYRESQVLYYRTHRPGYEQLLLRVYLGLAGKSPHETT